MVSYQQRCHPSYEIGIVREFSNCRWWPLGRG